MTSLADPLEIEPPVVADGRRPNPVARWLSDLGPGLVTGAADDDPSGIATYSQIGAQFGYGLGWTLVLSLPLMIAIQLVSGRVGLVTGAGIARNIRLHMPRSVLIAVVLTLLVANIFNIGADLGAMGAVIALLLPGPAWGWMLCAALACVGLEIFLSYRRYAAILKWTTLSLFAYPAVLFAIHVPWTSALAGSLWPAHFGGDEWVALIAVLGTTISPYLFFWQAGQEIEEQRRRGTSPLLVDGSRAAGELTRLRLDTVSGMVVSNLVALFIVFATAATLHVHGILQIETAAQAAEALRPIAGRAAFALFALGIIGTGLLAIPVLAGSAAYAVTEAIDRQEGLDRKPAQAPIFYLVITLAAACGAALTFLPIPPMTALYWAAILNGVLAAPVMIVIMLLASSVTIMGRLSAGRGLRVLGWAAAFVMALASAGLFLP